MKTSKAARLVLASTLAFAATAPVLAQQDSRTCLRWSEPAGAAMDIRQSNGITVHLRPHVTGNRVQGSASYLVPGKPVPGVLGWIGLIDSFGGDMRGQLNGTVWNDYIEFRVNWENGSQGYYSGPINRGGHVYGTTYRVGAPGSQTIWTTVSPFVCTQRDPGPPQPVTVPGLQVLKPSTGSAGAKAAGALFGGGGTLSGAPATVPQSQAPAVTPVPVAPGNPMTCRSGFVWRVARPTDLVCVTPNSRERVSHENAIAPKRVQPGGGAYGPNTCRAGYVWREAFVGDLVCVTPAVRAAVAEENRLAVSRRAQYAPRADLNSQGAAPRSRVG